MIQIRYQVLKLMFRLQTIFVRKSLDPLLYENLSWRLFPFTNGIK